MPKIKQEVCLCSLGAAKLPWTGVLVGLPTLGGKIPGDLVMGTRKGGVYGWEGP